MFPLKSPTKYLAYPCNQNAIGSFVRQSDGVGSHSDLSNGESDQAHVNPCVNASIDIGAARPRYLGRVRLCCPDERLDASLDARFAGFCEGRERSVFDTFAKLNHLCGGHPRGSNGPHHQRLHWQRQSVCPRYVRAGAGPGRKRNLWPRLVPMQRPLVRHHTRRNNSQRLDLLYTCEPQRGGQRQRLSFHS